MFHSKQKIIVSSLGGPVFTTRFLNIEKEIQKTGANFIIYDTSKASYLITMLLDFFKKNKINWKYSLIEKKHIIFHSFSRSIFPGEYLKSLEINKMNKHSPCNKKKLIQANANIIM